MQKFDLHDLATLALSPCLRVWCTLDCACISLYPESGYIIYGYFIVFKLVDVTISTRSLCQRSKTRTYVADPGSASSATPVPFYVIVFYKLCTSHLSLLKTPN